MSKKSKIAKQIAESFGLPVIEVKVSDIMKRPDFKGLPIPDITVFDEVQNPFEIDDQVLMEIQPGVVVTAFVDAIVDGILYATGDDGEPYCAPLVNCDKVPH